MLKKDEQLYPRAVRLNRTLNANESQHVAIAGSFVYIYATSGELGIDFGSVIIPVTEGDSFDFEDAEFTGFRLVDLSGAANTIAIIISTGKFDRKELTGQITMTVAANAEDKEDVTLTGGVDLVCAANAARRRVTVVSNFNNAGNMRVGGSTISATRGITIMPGQNASFDVTGAIYALGTLGDKVEIVEETN